MRICARVDVAQGKIPCYEHGMSSPLSAGHFFLYGTHAVQAALDNPKRVKRTLYMTGNAADRMTVPPKIYAHTVDSDWLDKHLPPHSVHQGVALEVQALPQPSLRELAAMGKPLIMLDQVSDPQNIGAILRSAAAFDAAGVIVQEKNAPRESATMAKIAAGALESVALVSVTNLTRALKELQTLDYWSVGLDSEAEYALSKHKLGLRTVLVMGAEGAGLRRLIAENCDLLGKLPIYGQMESLNVSVATGIALYVLAEKTR